MRRSNPGGGVDLTRGDPEEYVEAGEVVACADGIGKQLLTVVSIHKPGRWPERVFYTRRWADPDGKQFGKTRLRVTTTQVFRRLIKGYRWPYEVVE